MELDPRRHMANSLIVATRRKTRAGRSRGTFFPFVDMLEGGHGLHLVRVRAVHAQQRAPLQHVPAAEQLHQIQREPRADVRGQLEHYDSENVFFPGSQSIYVYNSLADFYTDANGFLANPNRTTSPVTLRSFQVRWNNIPGQEKPLQPLRGVLRRRVRAGRLAGPRNLN